MALLLLLVVHVLSMSFHVSSLSVASDLNSDYDWTPTKLTPAVQDIPAPPYIKAQNREVSTPQKNITVQANKKISKQKNIQNPAQDIYYTPATKYNIHSYQQPQFNNLQDVTSQSQYWNQPVRANTIQTHLGLPDNLSDKTWNVPAPNIPPAKNLIEDVSFNIGIILVVFTVCVIGLGATAGALTTKVNAGRTLGYVEEASDLVFRGIERIGKLNMPN